MQFEEQNKTTCYVSSVGLNKKVITNYIRNQELEDEISDKRSFKEYKVNWANKKALKSGSPIICLGNISKNHV